MSLMDGYLNQMIDHIYSVTRNRYGDATFKIEYSDVPCRWVKKVTQVLGPNNEEVLSRVVVWLPLEYESIKHDWKITKDSEDYYVLSSESKVDLDGNVDHVKLFLV